MNKNYVIFILVLSFFVFACKEDSSSESSTTTTAAATPGIKIVNISDISTTDLETWTTAAAAKMKSQTANILSVSWNVGAAVSVGGFNRPFNTHTVVITSEQIETLMTEINTWLDTTCINAETKSEESTNFRNYITNGADASLHLVMCKQYRIVLMGIIEGNSLADSKHLVIHEFYHAFQQDLGDEDCSKKRDVEGSNGKGWIIEGSADYFSQIEIHGSTSGVQKILKSGLEAYQADSSADIAGEAVASRGAAGLRLMVKRGTLTESNILDGSLFHSCATESDYTDSNSNIVTAESKWYKIQESNGTYSFKSEALQ